MSGSFWEETENSNEQWWRTMPVVATGHPRLPDNDKDRGHVTNGNKLTFLIKIY